MMWMFVLMGKSNPISWEVVAKGYMSGVMEEKAVWWDSTYANLVENGDERTLLVFLGQRPTGGYSVEIEEIKSDGKSLTVVAKEICPKPGSMVIQVITSPFVAVRVDVPKPLPVKLKVKRCKE
ncbi:MAG: protease complex subunit PrcB family protein [Thermotogae bacterium]|nr:protease complex subunit PrcB family protein [Thermotogota bacterium]